MNEVIIRILDSSNNVLGDLDLKDFNDFPLVITKGIVNLDNLKTRTGTYTKTFKVPNTKNNSTLLSNVDNINTRKDINNSLDRKPCAIIVNGNEIEKGFVQVSKSYNGFEVENFELVFFGNNIDWVKQASETKLNSLTFANNAQVYDLTNIQAANSATSSTYDHCYPYISRGGTEGINTSKVEDYFPCFYLSNTLKRGLNELGWNVNSNFLNDADINKLACDLNGDMRVAQSVVDDSKTRASNTSNQQFLAYGVPAKLTKINFQDETTYPNEDNNNNYDPLTGFYKAPSTGRYTFEVSLNIINFNNPNNTNPLTRELQVYVCKGDSTSVINASSANVLDFKKKLVNVTDDINVVFQLSSNLVKDEEVVLRFRFEPIAPLLDGQNAGEFGAGSFFEVQRSYELKEGDDFNLNDVIPDDIKLIDVINDFTRMFNIYYWTDIKTKTIYLEPRNTFFKDTVDALDWSDKLALNKSYEIDYVSSYKRNIKFSYKDLDSDEWLKGWQKTYKRKYGEYTHELPNRFGEGTTEIKLDLFSASYQHIANEATPLNERPYTTLKYWNEYKEGYPDTRINGYNSRIFFFQYAEQYELNGDRRTYSINGRTSNFIPYASFEEYNNTTPPQNLSFTGDDGLFNTYYSKMMKNIEEGGRLVGYFNLTSVDIDNLDFRKLVYINAPAQARGYYLVESVEDYNPIKNGLTKVSLFKFEDLGSVDIDDSQQGNNNSSDDNASEETLDPIFIEKDGLLVEVWHELSDGTGYRQVFK